MKTTVLRYRLMLLLLPMLLLGGCAKSGGHKAGTREVVDMAGRKMEVPAVIRRVYSTRPGSVVLYAVAPDLMVNRSLWTTAGSEKFMLDSYLKLPFAEGSAEEIIRLRPDVIISYFVINPKTIDEANRLSAKTGIPVFMVDMSMKQYPKAFAAMGDLLGRKTQTDRMTGFVEKYLVPVMARAERIPENQRRRVYYAEGNRGLNTDPSGSFHSEVLDLVGGENVARVNVLAGKGLSAVSMEQLLQWKPEVVLVWTGMGRSLTTYQAIRADPLWAKVPAIQAGRLHQIPYQPFGWFDRPPGTNRIMGAIWLSRLLYPELYPDDLGQVTREYFSIFFHRDLTDAELQEVLHPLADASVPKKKVAQQTLKP
ncbi:MAG: ABC transporter substrate-binding protein [Chlorobiaceae bacterium]|nr:ABC transporter substrate-binding protein [Chlorobiaceae bacterium]